MAGTSGNVATLADTHGLVTRAGTQIWASSEGRGWRSLFASAQREAPFEDHCPAIADHLVVVHLSGPVRVKRTLAGKQESCLTPPGGVFIMPGGVEFDVRLEGPLDTVHFYLHRSIVDEIADESDLDEIATAPTCLVDLLLRRRHRHEHHALLAEMAADKSEALRIVAGGSADEQFGLVARRKRLAKEIEGSADLVGAHRR